ncbi:TetR/AcrR family transcriptional regulator [Paenirhodobacter hankyongi]|uniref:TetR/AcrR family transcriptional regulator n=1 Tax=Paenirhodobacter hankyongi TaxID=2294033 RepID=A0A421BKN4_9RHOB|nr:TetR family transcriptional regulator [Sinirhodobacter hankyongi]RLL63593.1 TetR/AcrR family transcriptional regulator [Sinirhodobacter hankyongi]
MATPGNSRGTVVDQADMRESLLETAVEMFSEKGFSGTSIRDIAREHGVSLSNIYYYFSNKEGLWREIMNRSVRSLPGRLRAAIAQADTPRAQLDALIREHLRAGVEHQRELLMLLTEQGQLGEDSSRETLEIQREILEIYTAVLEALSAEGALHEGHIRVAVFNILGVVNWHLRWYRADGPLPADTLHQEITNFISRAVCRD